MLTKLSADLVDEGRMMLSLNEAMERIGGRVCQNFGDHGDAKLAKGEIVLKIIIAKDEKYQSHFRIDYDLQCKDPKQPAGNSSFAVMVKNNLAVQESGASRENPNQESLFNKLKKSDEED